MGVKIKLSLPATLLQEADAAAKDIGVSRGKLIQIALDLYRREDVSARYDPGLAEDSDAWPADRPRRTRSQEQSERTTVSLPADLIASAKAVAEDLKISQSVLFRAALESFLRKGREDAIKAALNWYAAGPGELSEEDEILLEHARQMVRRVEWYE